jgi:hypothetical protein
VEGAVCRGWGRRSGEKIRLTHINKRGHHLTGYIFFIQKGIIIEAFFLLLLSLRLTGPDSKQVLFNLVEFLLSFSPILVEDVIFFNEKFEESNGTAMSFSPSLTSANSMTSLVP